MKKLAATVSGRSNFSPKFETFLSEKSTLTIRQILKLEESQEIRCNYELWLRNDQQRWKKWEKIIRRNLQSLWSEEFLLSILPSNERTKHSFNNSNVIFLWFKMGSRKSINTVCIIWFFIWYFYKNCSWASAAETTKTNWKLFA